MNAQNLKKSKEAETSKDMGNAKSAVYEVPAEGSLGLLALGYQGLIAWREARKKKGSTNKPSSQ